MMSKQPEPTVGVARATLRRGKLIEARRHAAALHERRPEDPDVQVLLYELLHASGKSGIAELGLEQIVATFPSSSTAWIALGLIHRDAGNLARVAEVIANVGQRADLAAESHIDLSTLHRLTGNLDAAECHARAAVAADGQLGEGHLALAETLLDRPDGLDAARRSMESAITLEPRLTARHHQAALICRTNGDEAGALIQLRRAHDLMPDDASVRYMLQACAEPAAVSRAPDDYLAEHFDRFSAHFDDQLREHLEYRTPELLVEAVRAALGAQDGTLDVLDAGCGTGLCGPLLRPLSRTLTGVDLSGGMLRLAAQRGSYDELAEEELTAFLQAHPAAYDLVLAADVLVYFGDLEPIVRAAAAALRPAGLLAFSVECAEDCVPGYRLATSGRFSHAHDHVVAACASVGLAAELKRSILRLETGRPVAGYLVVATAQDRTSR